MSRTPSETVPPEVLAGPKPVLRGAAVRVQELTWRPFGRREPVLAGISLHVEAGSRVLLAGPSGSGKSTLLRALAGVLTTTETGDLTGSVLIDGSPPSGSSVGLMMQDPADALVAGRVGRDVAFGPESFGMPRGQIWSRVRSALASVGFPYDEDHPTSALSGGEAQRLALAGVLALTPRLVLLDEPTSMLDPAAAAVVRTAIVSAVRASGATLVMVEHQLSDWVDEVDRLVVLDRTGRVSADGPVVATLARQADALAAQGVWVPGVPPPGRLEVARVLCAPTHPAGSARPATPATPAGTNRGGPGLPDISRIPESARRRQGSPDGVLVRAESVSVVRRPRASVMSANRPATPVQALTEVFAEVRPGECVAVVGPSGAGKSTLTALLAGVDAPTRGRVTGLGPLRTGLGANPPEDLHRWTSRDLAARFGWVPQQAGQAVVGRTVRDDVLSTSRSLGLDDDVAQTRVDGLLEVLGLTALAGVDPHCLSGGEQRRLALAGAIAHGPSVLVLDEPSVGQDRLTWSAVAGVVVAARGAGVGVVLATHDPLLIALADRRITLQAGRGLAPAATGAPAATPAPAATRAVVRFAGLAGRSGPLSLLTASLALVLGAPFIADLRTALIAIGVQIVLAPFVLGFGRPQWRRLLPGLVAVASVAFSNWLLSPGREVSSGALAGLRVAFFVIPGVLLASRIDPSALGDHLGQRLRLPARPVVAAVAALYRFESLGEHWAQLARVRRVRGRGPGRSPLSRARALGALTFGLLIETLRQAGRMAVAMEARGFSATVPPVEVTAVNVFPHLPEDAHLSVPARDVFPHVPEDAHLSVPARDVFPHVPAVEPTSSPSLRRTWAEPAPWRPADSLMLALALIVAGIPMLVSRW